MVWAELDELDKRIIHALQADSRHTSSNDIAEGMDVSSSTVRNRIKKLEEKGIIDGYTLRLDYETAGSQLYTHIVCTAPIPDRGRLAKEAMEVSGVVHVREIMKGDENVHVAAVGTDADDLTRIGRELDAIGLTVTEEDLIHNEYDHPYHAFGPDGE
jgi:DNA-binding Lrp family transcriptional regulator